MRTPVILADFPAGAVTSLFIMITAGAILSLCLLIAGVLHTTGNHDDRNRFCGRQNYVCWLVSSWLRFWVCLRRFWIYRDFVLRGDATPFRVVELKAGSSKIATLRRREATLG